MSVSVEKYINSHRKINNNHIIQYILGNFLIILQESLLRIKLFKPLCAIFYHYYFFS